MRRHHTWLLLAVALLPLASGQFAVQVPAQAQAPAPPSGLILGQVVDAVTNKPIANAIVTLTGGGVAPRLVIAGAPTPPARVLTDADGHFVFRDLSKGTYAFSATAPGYLNGGYGQRRPEGAMQRFALEDGQRVGDVVVRLWKESVIGGTVTDETGAPVTGVTVLITRRTTVNGRVELRIHQYGKRTDDRGIYSHDGIPPGEYVVSVPAGMTVARVGQAGPDAAAAASLRASGADALATGMPARSAGSRIADFVVLPGGLNALAGQLPLTTRPDGRVMTYATTFHPSSGTLAAAGVVQIGVGEARTDIDILLRAVPTAPISGIVLTPTGPAVNLAVHLIPSYAAHTSAERSFESAVAVTDPAGKFIFPAVAAGPYTIEVWRKPTRNSSLVDALPSEPSLWAEASVVVDGAPTTVTLNMRRGAALTGRIVLDGTLTPPRPQQFQAVLGSWFQPPWPLAFNAGPIAETRVTPSWDFMKEGMPPGTYPLNVASNFGPPAGWFLKSATHEGRDLLTSPLVLDGEDVSGIVITFTDRPVTLSGLVTDSTGKPDPGAAVLVLPADYQTWLRNGRPAAASRAVATTQTGSYAVPDLPPGDYLIVAATIDVLDDWPGSAIEGLVGQATRMSLASGTATRVDLRRR